MGCGTSIYDNPDFIKLSTENSESYKLKNNKIFPTHSNSNNGHLNDNTPLTRSHSSLPRSNISDRSNVTRSRNSGNGSWMTNSTTCERRSEALVGILANGSARSRVTSRAGSPVNSEASSFKPVKRVIFNETPADTETHEENRSPSSQNQLVLVSLNDKKRAKHKREKALRNRLLSRLTEAEDMSAAIMLDNDRLSIGSSLSHTTSRTASPFPVDAPSSDRASTSINTQHSESSTNHNTADVSSTIKIADKVSLSNDMTGDLNSAIQWAAGSENSTTVT